MVPACASAGAWEDASYWGLIRNDGGFNNSPTPKAEDNNVTYFVIKLDFDAAGNERAALWNSGYNEIV